MACIALENLTGPFGDTALSLPTPRRECRSTAARCLRGEPHVPDQLVECVPVLLDMFTLSYPTKRYQSAWIGIALHSSQSVFVAAIVLPLVL
jgi:hypothetical protein